MGMPDTTGKRHAQKTCSKYFSRRGHVNTLLLQHEANRCRGFAWDGYQGHDLAVSQFETACGLQWLAGRFQLDFLLIGADEDGQFGVGLRDIHRLAMIAQMQLNQIRLGNQFVIPCLSGCHRHPLDVVGRDFLAYSSA